MVPRFCTLHTYETSTTRVRERPMACQHPASYVSWLTEEMYYRCLEVAKMLHLLTWVCSKAGFDLFKSTEIFK